MNILFILDIFDNGGVSKILLNLLKKLKREKYNITLLLFNKNPGFDCLLPKNIKVRYAFNKAPDRSRHKLVRFVNGICKSFIPKFLIKHILFNGKYDLAIDFKSNNIHTLLAFNGKKIMWLHKDFSISTNLVEKEMLKVYGKTIRYKLKQHYFVKSLKKVDKIVLISETTRASFVNRYGFSEKTIVLYNPIDADEITKLSIESIYDWERRRLTICCVSRISKGKGIDRLFNIADKLNKNNMLFDLLIIGDGDGFRETQALFEKFNFENVFLLGHRNNPYPYIKNSDLFVCPSETEAFSTVIAEASIIGIPIIATDTGATAEIIQNYGSGFITKNTEDELYKAIHSFISNQLNVHNISNSNHVLADFNRTVAEIEGFFDGFGESNV